MLSKDEILDGYTQLYGEVQAKEQVDILMQGVDWDGDGTVNYNEFLAFSLNKQKLLSKNNLEAAFRTFDRVSIFLD